MMKRLVWLVALGALGSAAVVGTAQAQNAQARQGFWFSGGLGYGSLGCDNCGSREGGVSGGLSLGGTITPRFLLGVGTSGWTKSEQGATLTVGETPDFLAQGGIINFILEGGKVRFQIDSKAAERADLRISSHLLRLARGPETRVER